jgi:hypothetical protein
VAGFHRGLAEKHDTSADQAADHQQRRPVAREATHIKPPD